VHLSITLANDQLDTQIFNTFITIPYMCMFRAISCSSSGGQIVLIQHLVSSLSVSDFPVHKLRKNFSKNVSEHKMCVSIFSTNLSEIFFILRRTERDMIKNVYWSACKLSVLLVLLQRILKFLDRFSKNTQIYNYMTISPLGAE
jgi:hypothetical protein